jgi:hypothetical protein
MFPGCRRLVSNFGTEEGAMTDALIKDKVNKLRRFHAGLQFGVVELNLWRYRCLQSEFVQCPDESYLCDKRSYRRFKDS